MSDLKEILTQPQRIKHHEVLQFLSSHPNVEYSIAQLDYLLPRGAALQRFPREWFDFMERGDCGNRNIELNIETGGNITAEPSRSSLSFSRPPPDKTFLICRRPELHSMKELQQLINTPAAMPDPEECVGLHTDQIIISRDLLRDCQRAGLAFYFPDKYVKESINTPAIGAASGGSDAGGKFSASTTAGVESLLSQQELLSEVSGVPTATVLLPLGVRVRHKFFTWRGVTTSNTHCLPICFHPQERLLVTFDNENAALRQIPGTKDSLLVRWRIVVPGGSSSTSMSPTASGNAEPLSIRARSITSEKILPASRSTFSGITNIDSSKYVSDSGQKIRYTKIQMDIEATRVASPFKLIFVVNGQECAVDMEVVDVETGLPGVLIGRECEPNNFSLPLAYRLMDPAVMGASMAPAQLTPRSAQQRDTADDKLSGGGKPQGSMGAASQPSSPMKGFDRTTYGLLPWWQNSSPLVLGVREATYPMEGAVSAATGIVYAQRALLHEAQLRAVRHLMRNQTGIEGQSSSAQQDRRRVRHRQDLRNRHMLHFGLDASVPFSPKREGI